jgi:hypothetical protein
MLLRPAAGESDPSEVSDTTEGVEGPGAMGSRRFPVCRSGVIPWGIARCEMRGVFGMLSKRACSGSSGGIANG